MQEQESKLPQPDNSYVKENDGYTFTAWGIHVAAQSLNDAKEHIKQYHGKDVDVDTPPLKPQE